MTTSDILSFVPSSQQTKEWRKNADWYFTGKFNECEKHQIRGVQQVIFPKVLEKTDDRIHTEMLKIVSQRTPLKCADGYEYTENFDGKVQTGGDMVYFNLKFVCDAGGSQTRTLREVYHFIRFQMEVLLKLSMEEQRHLYFVNILDGDTCYKNAKHFDYLLQKEKYKNVIQNIFVGDLYTFQTCNLVKKMTE